jgi:hypothetical protein
MKTSSNILKGIQFLLIAVLFISQAAFGQDSTKQTTQTTVKDWLNDRNFVFTPQTATPMRGRNVHLTSYFDLSVSKDTLVSNLPYYGRAYSASINPSENGLNFTSTKFDYNVTPRKKGGWDVSVKPKDANDVRDMTFTVFDNGKASLFVNSNNRESISFDGTVTQSKRR